MLANLLRYRVKRRLVRLQMMRTRSQLEARNDRHAATGDGRAEVLKSIKRGGRGRGGGHRCRKIFWGEGNTIYIYIYRCLLFFAGCVPI